MQALHDAGFRLVILTNQSGIAQGLYTEADLARVHAVLHEALGGLPAAYLHCPHHPDISLSDAIPARAADGSVAAAIGNLLVLRPDSEPLIEGLLAGTTRIDGFPRWRAARAAWDRRSEAVKRATLSGSPATVSR